MRAVLVYRGMRYESVKRSFDVVPGMSLGGGTQMFVDRERFKRQFAGLLAPQPRDRLFLRIEDEPGARIRGFD